MMVPEVAVALFDGPPETFVGRRDALVAQLRGAGRRDEATVVKVLRRPTVGAAVLNRLARTVPEQVEAVMAAAEALGQAQRRALSGVAADVRGAVRAHHEAVAALLAEVGDPLPVAVADKVRHTLQAAAVVPEVAERLRRGVLSTTVDPPDAAASLGGFAPLGVVPGPPEGAEDPSERPAADEDAAEDAAEAAVRLAGARREAMRAEAALDEVRSAELGARRRLEEGRRVAATLQEAAGSARGRAEEAAATAARLAAAAEEADVRAREATDLLADLERALAAAEEDVSRREAARAAAVEAVAAAGGDAPPGEAGPGG